MSRLPILLSLILLVAACDSSGNDSNNLRSNATVEVDGLDPYTFSEPATATLQPVPGASTQVLSLRFNEQPSTDNRIGLSLDLESDQLTADSTYVLHSVISRSHIGDGEPSMWARFFDCPVNQVGFCERDYFAISGEATLFFVQIIALTEARVEGAFGFVGFSTANPTNPKVNGTFSVPLEQ